MAQDLEANTKLMPVMCPECGTMESILHIHPHQYAGIYECTNKDCSASWECSHPTFHEEDHEVDTMRNGEHDTYKTKILVCDECEVDCTDDKTIHYEAPDPGGCEGCQ
jgi:hypothetical protein